MSNRRYWKLREFVAHSSPVTGLAFGHYTGRLLVTGCEDGKVHLWEVSNSHCMMNLTGHTSAVEALQFDLEENIVSAGSKSGSIKTWDLCAQKLIRTLLGHKSNIRTLDFHLTGDFLASGSVDTNIKLWDTRRKGCIFTYKGHTDAVNQVRFSPDGKWLVSAGQDALIKIWDLAAGKLLTEFKEHSGPVNGISFHPQELLLASAGQDRTVKFFDVHQMQYLTSTDGESNPVRSILFHPDGECLFAGSADMLKLYHWEPRRCFHSLVTGWGRLADMTLSQSQLIAASFFDCNVSTYVVDIMKCPPFSGRPLSSALSENRRHFIKDKQSSPPKEEPEEEPSSDAVTPTALQHKSNAGGPPADSPSGADEVLVQNAEDYSQFFSRKSRNPPAANPGSAPSPRAGVAAPNFAPLAPPGAAEDESDSPLPPKNALPGAPKQTIPSSAISDDGSPRADSKDTDREISETDCLASLEKAHESMRTVLGQRTKHLQTIRALWTRDNPISAVKSASHINDSSVMVDILTVLNQDSSNWNLDLCTVILPQIKLLAAAKYDSHVHTAMNSLKIVLKNYGANIKSTSNADAGIGVDLHREERIRKCRECRAMLEGIRAVLEQQQRSQNARRYRYRLASTYGEVLVLLNTVLT